KFLTVVMEFPGSSSMIRSIRLNRMAHLCRRNPLPMNAFRTMELISLPFIAKPPIRGKVSLTAAPLLSKRTKPSTALCVCEDCKAWGRFDDLKRTYHLPVATLELFRHSLRG